MDIHLLCCTHEHTKTHDAIHNTFVAIVQDVGFHVGQEQLHVLLSTTFNSFHWQVNIVFTKYNICTLVNVIIVDPTWMDLLPWYCATQGFAASNVVQAKEKNYCNQHPTDQFLPIVIEVFSCLHKYANVFL
jgi:hypothetical protein